MVRPHPYGPERAKNQLYKVGKNLALHGGMPSHPARLLRHNLLNLIKLVLKPSGVPLSGHRLRKLRKDRKMIPITTHYSFAYIISSDLKCSTN